MGYWEENKNKVQETPGGELCQVFGENERANSSVALVKMNVGQNGLPHYHDNITEIYAFATGKGFIEIGDNKKRIEQGDVYVVTPNNSHFIQAKTEMEFVCICIPPWNIKHEFLNADKKTNDIKKQEKEGIIFENQEKTVTVKANKISVRTKYSIKRRTVFYFQVGEGKIIIDGKEQSIHMGEAFLVEPRQEVTIIPEHELKYISATDGYEMKLN